MGWRASVFEENDNSYSHVINISPAKGRFIEKGYSGRWVIGVSLLECHQTRIANDNALLDYVY